MLFSLLGVIIFVTRRNSRRKREQKTHLQLLSLTKRNENSRRKREQKTLFEHRDSQRLSRQRLLVAVVVKGVVQH
jgi:hypothetical protein